MSNSPPLFPPEVSAALDAKKTDCQKCGAAASTLALHSERVEVVKGRMLAAAKPMAVRRYRCTGCSEVWVAVADLPDGFKP